MAIGTGSTTDPIQAVSEAVGAGDLARGFDLATTALRNGVRHPIVHNARALWLQQQNRLDEALTAFQQALQMTPRDATLLNAIGLCHVRAGHATEGVAAFEAALKLQPDNAVTHYRKGWALEATGDQPSARACYERALELNPDYSEALAGLAVIAARDSRPDDARALAARCRAIDPTEPTAIVALAIVENAAGQFEAAEALLRESLADRRAVGHTRAVLLGFLGDALDGQDRTAEAFAAWAAKGAEFRRLHAARLAAAPPATKTMASLAAYLASTPADKWAGRDAPRPADRAPREHVFLLGFLRSGTTLLERVLASHPDVVNLEERESLAEPTRQYMHVPMGLDRLAALSGTAYDNARAAYWRAVRGFGVEPEGKVFIDKQPLNTFNLPLISRLFPEAKVLFALRDPRDVVFSCFRRHFEVNPVMFEFLDIADGARFYAAVMNVGALARAKLPLEVHEHRYEDMIADFDGRVRAVCDFLNLEWTETMRDFAEKARAETIRSPSAAQVRRPLYSEGVGQWRRYATEMAPALPILAPWVKHFGYPAD